MWKRNLALVLAFHIGMILFPFIAVSSEKLTAYRVALAIITSATIYSLEVALIYIIFNRYGVKFKEGIFRLLELKEEEYRRLSKKERDMFYKLGFVIIGTPGLAMIISGGILEWGNPITALKFLIVFSAFLIPLLQVCILPLIVLFTTYNRFIAKDLNTCIESSVFWTRLSLLGLLLVVLSLFSSDEKESLPIVSTILNNWDLFLIMSLFNVLVGVLNYAIVVNSKVFLVPLLLAFYSSPAIGIALLLDLFGLASFQESVKIATIAALAIFIAMFAVTYSCLESSATLSPLLKKRLQVLNLRKH